MSIQRENPKPEPEAGSFMCISAENSDQGLSSLPIQGPDKIKIYINWHRKTTCDVMIVWEQDQKGS